MFFLLCLISVTPHSFDTVLPGCQSISLYFWIETIFFFILHSLVSGQDRFLFRRVFDVWFMFLRFSRYHTLHHIEVKILMLDSTPKKKKEWNNRHT